MNQLRPAHALAAGAIEQDGVAIGFPNGSEFHTARTMQAKEDSAGTAAADKHSFGNVKCTYLQFILLANCVVDVTAKVVQVVNL
jgi:hypothetical protein